ncbi:MAG: hypothetical protein RLZZ440_2309, partial [Planctomycetota bacterium]
MKTSSPPLPRFMDRLILCRVALVCWAMLAAVQPQARQPEPAAGGTAAASAVRETLPELYYLEDDSGRLVPVPGFRYRDFMELFRLREGLAGAAQPPALVVERVRYRIDARGESRSDRAWAAAVE